MTDPLNAGDYIDVTITLSQAVTNLSFRIHDIDKTGSTQQYGWNDEVWVQTAGFTAVKGTNVIGTGTDADAFRNNVFGDQAIDSGLNHVDLKWAGSLSQVKFRYRARNSGNSGNQHIGIGNISFSDCVANPTSAPASRRSRARRLAASCRERRGISWRGGTTDPRSLTGGGPAPLTSPGSGRLSGFRDGCGFETARIRVRPLAPLDFRGCLGEGTPCERGVP